MTIRDVNSREIAFSGRVAIPQSRSRLLISPEYKVSFTGVIKVGSPVGAQGGVGGIAGRTPTLFPADAGTPSIPLAHPKRHKTAGGGSYKGSATGEAQWLIGPHTMGWGITVPLLPPPCQTPLDNQSTSREDGRVKRRAAARSLAPWRTCHNADMERDGDGRRDRQPAPRRRVRETPGPLSDAAGRSANISVIFLVSYRGRLKWPHLHCWAEAVV